MRHIKVNRPHRGLVWRRVPMESHYDLIEFKMVYEDIFVWFVLYAYINRRLQFVSCAIPEDVWQDMHNWERVRVWTLMHRRWKEVFDADSSCSAS